MSAARPTVLITGAGGPIGVNVTRSLRMLDDAPRLVGTDCNRYHLCLALTDVIEEIPPAREREAYFAALRDICQRESVDMLLPTHPVEVRALLELGEALDALEVARCLPPLDVVERCQSKWKSYQRFILHHARLAQRARAEILCIGSELVTTEKMRGRWAKLIKQIRRVYRGKLLYSANWDHYDPVSFWDLIDLVGLTAYYSLAQRRDAKVPEMVQAWGRAKKKLVSWARRKKRRLVFTEVGYPSLDGGAVSPWDYTQGTSVDLDEQRRAFQAFVKAWDKVPELQGVFFWDWYGGGGPKDKSYTPRGKPAAKVIEAWYKRLAAAEKR